MIELLFRAHITDTWELIYSRTVQDKYKFTMYFAEWLVIEKPSTNPRSLEYVDATIQQFTGLYDNNLKEIYEWDIMQYYLEWNKKWWDVKYIDWAFYVTFYTSQCTRRTQILSAFLRDKKTSIVIWNIYQNPELLNTSTS